MSNRQDELGHESLDDLAAALRALRLERGSPSFSELVRSIARQREARGLSPAAARPGRTTVYDAFRDGRTRVDAKLVGEIVRALGVDEAEAVAWEERCRRARRPVVTVEGPATPPAVTPSTPLETVAADEPEPPRRSPTRRSAVVVALVLGCVALNLLGRGFVELLGLPIHLDMTGTAVAAFALGPWPAVVVGILSSVLGGAVNGVVSLYFAPVSAVGALLWGYGWRRLDPTRHGPMDILKLTLGTAVACSLVAVPIILALGGSVGHAADPTTARVARLLQHLPAALLLSNIVYSLIDKVLSAFVALAVVDRLESRRATHDLHPRRHEGGAGPVRPAPG